MSFSKTVLGGTKRVYSALENSSPGAPRERYWTNRGLRDSCVVLGDLLIDPEFMAFVAEDRQRQILTDGMAVLDQYRSNRAALNEFLSAERDLFALAGLPDSLAGSLVSRVSQAVATPPGERIELSRTISELRSYVCGQADAFDLTKRRGILGGMFGVFGGLCVAALNGGLLTQTVGMSGAMLAVSMTAGGIIANNGCGTVRRFF